MKLTEDKEFRPEPLLVDAKTAAGMLGIGKSHFQALLSAGKIGPMAQHLGRRSLFSVRELREWVDAGTPPRQRWIEKKKANFQNNCLRNRNHGV